MTSAHLLTVYERSGCHLCDDMVSTLSEWKTELGFDIERVDVDASPGLAARYGTRVPVLVYGSIEVCHYFLDLDALHRALGDGTGPERRLPGEPDPADGSEEGGGSLRDAGRYPRIYAIVRRIPHGRVATYGQIAAIEGNSSARMVGYAMAALSGPYPAVPWQRVLNATGAVSERSGGGGTSGRPPAPARGPRSRGRRVRRDGAHRLRHVRLGRPRHRLDRAPRVPSRGAAALDRARAPEMIGRVRTRGPSRHRAPRTGSP